MNKNQSLGIVEVGKFSGGKTQNINWNLLYLLNTIYTESNSMFVRLMKLVND